VLIDRIARRLDDEDVGAADVLVDLERNLGIGNRRSLAWPTCTPRNAAISRVNS